MKTYAFDLDGTLITAENKQLVLLRAVCRRFGLALDLSDAWRRKRDGASNLKLLGELGVGSETAAAVTSAWQREVESPYWLSYDELYPDALGCLELVRRRGGQAVLVTARSNEYLMRQQVRRLGLSEYFKAIYCVAPQRAAESKARVLEDVGALAFFGDAETDAEAARQAKVPFFALSTGQRSEAFLVANGIVDVNSSLRSAVERALGCA